MIETEELKGKISSDNKIKGGNTAISGPQGKDGLSAYEVAVKNGYIGTEEEWLINLKGEKGDQGEQGIQGPKGEQGEVSLEQLNILQAKTIKCLQEVETPTPVSGTSIDLSDSAEMRCELKISGNSKRETRNGKNKLNSASIGVGTNNGITCTYDSKTGIITFNGACNTDNTRFIFENTSIPFTNNLTKTLAYYVSGSITKYCSFRTFDSEWSAGETLNLLDLSSSKNKTRIISSNTTIKTNIDIRFNNGSVANNFQIKLMITDSENDDYEQYGASPSPDYPSDNESCGDNGSINEVICNKNRLDKNNYRLGYISSTGGFVANNSVALFDYISVKPNTVLTFSQQKNYEYRYCYYDENKKFIYRSDAFTTKTSEITIPDNVNYIVFFINFGVSSITQDIIDEDKIQVEEGSTTDYVEHKSQTYTIPTQQPIRSIEIAKNTFLRDTFIKKNNKWFERHYINRLILDGTENWEYDSTYNYFRCPSYVFDKVPSTKSEESLIQISNYFKIETNWTTFRNSTTLNAFNPISNQGYKLLFRNTNYTTVEDFKAWLTSLYEAGTPVYVDYVLQTPLDIECTEEQSTILFDIEQNAKTYDKVTHMYSTDKISSYKDVTYKKDIETLFANTLVEGV